MKRQKINKRKMVLVDEKIHELLKRTAKQENMVLHSFVEYIICEYIKNNEIKDEKG